MVFVPLRLATFSPLIYLPLFCDGASFALLACAFWSFLSLRLYSWRFACLDLILGLGERPELECVIIGWLFC